MSIDYFRLVATMSSVSDDMDLMKVEDFIGRIQHYKSYKKGQNYQKEHCADCVWVLSKLTAMYEKTKEYARMRKTDDDRIEWDTLILEALDMPDETRTIGGPSPAKKPKIVQQPKKVEVKKAEKRIDDMLHQLAEVAANVDYFEELCCEMDKDGSEKHKSPKGETSIGHSAAEKPNKGSEKDDEEKKEESP